MVTVFNGSLPGASMSNESGNGSDEAWVGGSIRLWTVGIFGTMVSSLTVFGNLMVIVAVMRERNLRNATNLYVFSLAVADLIMGLLVMPFSVVNDTIQWPLNEDACDAWRATDVFLSTASIMHLCVIAVERYSAITNPIGHYVSRTKLAVSIVSVWLVSLVISYPAILWWRATRTQVPPGVCPFTEDTTYLIVSSFISFYLPSAVMVFVYIKILRTAQRLTAGLRNGKLEITLPQSMSRRTLHNSLSTVTVRVHTGRHTPDVPKEREDAPCTTPNVSPCVWRRSAPPGQLTPRATLTTPQHIPNGYNSLPGSRRLALPTARQATYPAPPRPRESGNAVRDGVRMSVLSCGTDQMQDDETVLVSSLVRTPCDENKTFARDLHNGDYNCVSPPRSLSMTLSSRVDALSASSTRREQHKRKIQHEQKAAKTIAFIICLFIVSWTPFFLCNLVAAISPTSIIAPEITFVVVSWLGYTNSCMNFIIYSYSLTDFRVAFKKLFGCQHKPTRSSYIPPRWQMNDSAARQKQAVEYSSYFHSNALAADDR